MKKNKYNGITEKNIASLKELENTNKEADSIIVGVVPESIKKTEYLKAQIEIITNRLEKENEKFGSNNPVETFSATHKESLLNLPLNDRNSQNSGYSFSKNSKSIKELLQDVPSSEISNIFFSENNRITDYDTYEKIYELISLVGEAVQVYVDNIMSPDDWTRYGVNVYYEKNLSSNESELQKKVQINSNELIQKYNLEEKVETAISQSLTKGDYFTAVFSLKEELANVITESSGNISEEMLLKQDKFISQDIPSIEGTCYKDLLKLLNESLKETDQISESSFREDTAQYLNELMTVNHTSQPFIAKHAVLAKDFKEELDAKNNKAVSLLGYKKKYAPEDFSNISGSIVKMIDPEFVIKLYHDDVLFGYYYIEYVSDSSDFGKTYSSQSSLTRALDCSLASATSTILNPKDILINRLFSDSLSAKLKKKAFIEKNPQFSKDILSIIKNAKKDKQRVIITYVPPDQMIHWSPNGSEGYGESILSRIKFLGRLFIGMVTNAFMRNTVRNTEKLAYYIDVGLDNDSDGAIQEFIRTIKQHEIKFNNLKDITTMIKQIGEFHDFYIPTVKGERPIEIEAITTGVEAVMDSPFLEFLRKGIIAGMGIPSGYIGYSEEVPFSRTMTMENGRFLRRVVRHQRNYNKKYSQLIRLLWRNEYDSNPLENNENNENNENEKDKKDKEENILDRINPENIFAEFPIPLTLNNSNLSDQMTQATSIIDFVSTTMLAAEPESDTKELLSGIFKKEVTKEVLPYFNWEVYEDKLTIAKHIVTKGLIKSDTETLETGVEQGTDTEGYQGY